MIQLYKESVQYKFPFKKHTTPELFMLVYTSTQAVFTKTQLFSQKWETREPTWHPVVRYPIHLTWCPVINHIDFLRSVQIHSNNKPTKQALEIVLHS